MKLWRSSGNYQLFLLYEKERKEKMEKTFSCVTFKTMKTFGKLSIIFLHEKKKKKGKKPFQGKILSCKSLGNSNISFAVSYIRRSKYLQSIALLLLLEVAGFLPLSIGSWSCMRMSYFLARLLIVSFCL